jgi:hypothetical protein
MLILANNDSHAQDFNYVNIKIKVKKQLFFILSGVIK